MKKTLKIKAKNKSKIGIFSTIIISVVILSLVFFGIFYFLFDENILAKKGLNLYQNGQYKSAEQCYKIDTVIKKLFSVTLKSKKNKDFYSYFESKEEMIKILLERGNINKAVAEYQNMLKEVKDNIPNDEEMKNLINLQIANCYSTLGLYDKSIPIYEKLKSWYPQNLIQAYLDTKEYEKAKEILFSDKVRATIEDGGDFDAVALGYLLLSYYKAIGRYDLANTNYTEEAPSFETDITTAINLADLNFIQKNYETALSLYEELLSSPAFSQSMRHKIQSRYALVLYESGKSYQAEKAVEDIFQEQKELYELSPEVICTNYTASKVFVSKSKHYSEIAQKKFDRLKLPAESYFKDDLNYFCEINSRF